MEPEAVTEANDSSEVLYQWSARRVSPMVLLYVALVFAVFIALVHFVFHSPTAVRALSLTAVASMVPLVPTVLQKVEYRLIDRGLEKRPLRQENPESFEIVFGWKDVGHIKKVSRGFKFFKNLNEPNPLRRFWKTHVSDEYSGEVHIDRVDRGRVLEVLQRHGIRER